MRSEFLDDLPDGTTVEEEDYYDPGAFGGEKIVVYL
jgi:hypothetical protein